MPPKKRSSAAAEEYENDDGFVEDAPKSKKARTIKSEKGDKAPKIGGSTGQVSGGGTVSKDGEVYWELSGKRRIGITEFKGNRMINIREYYEKDGEMLPGKKGIALPIEQFNTIINLLPHIESVLAEKGETVAKPDYKGAETEAAAVKNDEEEEEEEVKGKKNFEETSDEE